jgi:hypothetical protein
VPGRTKAAKPLAPVATRGISGRQLSSSNDGRSMDRFSVKLAEQRSSDAVGRLVSVGD